MSVVPTMIATVMPRRRRGILRSDFCESDIAIRHSPELVSIVAMESLRRDALCSNAERRNLAMFRLLDRCSPSPAGFRDRHPKQRQGSERNARKEQEGGAVSGPLNDEAGDGVAERRAEAPRGRCRP